MLTAPLAYPKANLALAAARLRTSTLRSTRLTPAYRSGVTRLPSAIPRRFLKNSGGRHRPPSQLDLSDDVLFRHHAPVTAVGAVVPMVAHHEVVALRNHLGAPVVMATELCRHVVVLERDVVHVYAPVHDAHRVAFLGDDALDERFVRVERVIQHDDVAPARLADPVDQLVYDESVLILEGWRHALAFDARDLKPKGDNQDRVDG